ncbi:uncharacterized protein LOC105006331 [Esox lucius]|uniref:uncharacterized protein LOC105006331 n=1 Tax=Esox lucius TaxID=8010 RepID=UPI0014774206|nr:uncharacterized protein LOC105006331 [Esox lucius]
MEEEKREKQEEERRIREVGFSLEKTQSELQEKRRKERRAEEERRETTVVRETFQSQCSSPESRQPDRGLLSILSQKCGIPEGDIDLRRLHPQQVLSLSCSLRELLFQEWEEQPPQMDTLTHTQVLLAELCVMALDAHSNASLECAADQLQLAVQTVGYAVTVAVVEEEAWQYLNFTQALFLTFTNLFEDRPDSQQSVFSAANEWSQEDISLEQLFLVRFLELLLRALEKETGPVLGAQEKCLELILDAIGQWPLTETDSFAALSPAVLALLDVNWTSLEALDLIGSLARSRVSPSGALCVLDLVERHNLPSSWRDKQGHSLNTLLESTCDFNTFYSGLDKELQKESTHSLEVLLTQVPERLWSVINTVHKDMNKDNAVIFHKSLYRGSLRGSKFGQTELKILLSILSRAVLHTQGRGPTVAQMVRWCNLAINNSDDEFLTLERDPCVAVMHAALMVFQGRQVGIVLGSPSYRPQDWSSFYQMLGINVQTSTTVPLTQHCESDIVCGSLESFIHDFLQHGSGPRGRGLAPLPDCLILGQPLSNRDLCFPRLSQSSELAHNLTDLLHSLMPTSKNNADQCFKLMHTFLHTLSTLTKDIQLPFGEDLASIFQQFSKQAICPYQQYMLRFLETFLRSTCDTQTKEQCYELVTATAVQNCSEELCIESLSKLSDLVRSGRWAPADALDLFIFLVKKFRKGENLFTSVLTVLHSLEIHCVCPSFRDRDGCSLTQLLDSEASTTHLISRLRDSLSTEGEKSLEDILQEMCESNRSITETTLQEVRGIVASWQTCKIRTVPKFSKGSLKNCTLKREELAAVLFALCKAVYETQGWWPRTTQIVSWCLLALSVSGRLLQLGTGEGKSCVVAMFTAFRALRGERVDVLSSSPILSKRDADDWRPFYSLFDVSVDCNTDKDKDEDRRRCYSCDVVYGTAENFAADCLRQSFEMKEVRPDRGFQCVIVDEVDSLLLDKGVQMTYLSTDVAPMQHLNIVLAMIWGIVSQYGLVPTGTGTMIRGPVLPFHKALFDSVETEDGVEPLTVLQLAENSGLIPNGFCKDCDSTEKLTEKLKTVSQDTMLQFFRLAEDEFPYKFITYTQDQRGTLLRHSDNDSESEGEKNDHKVFFLVLEEGLCCALYEDEETLCDAIVEGVKDRLQFSACKPDKNDKCQCGADKHKTRVPGFLKVLVEKNLRVWVQNAFLAVKVQEGQEYIVDGEQILPVDYSCTGIVERNKKWGNGLQQFLEMKHQTKLSCMSIITNYLSNVAFFRQYGGQVYGTTGTLGTQSEIDLLQELYPGLSTCEIPSFNRKKLSEVKGVLESNVDKWRERICSSVLEQTRPTCYRDGRAALVICESINQAMDIHKALKEQVSGKQLRLYTNSNQDNSSITSQLLRPGDVIVATNLAGRGTDLLVSKEVNGAGGLFVVVTFLPENARVEMQAFGRTARKGSPGSAQLIICSAHLQEPLRNASTLQDARAARDSLAMDQVSRVLQDDIPEISLREELFSQYCQILKGIYQPFSNSSLGNLDIYNSKRRVTLAVLNEYWGIWLLRKSDEIEKLEKSQLMKSLETDIKRAHQQSQENLSPCSSIYHFIKFGNKLLGENKLKESAELYSSAIELDRCWAAIALYKRAYCTLRQKQKDCMENASKDLEKALVSVELFLEQCTITQQLVSLSDRDSGKTKSAFQKQMQVRIQVLTYFHNNISRAMEKLELIKQDKGEALVDESSVFNLVEDPNDDVHQELYEFYKLGMEMVFSVKQKPRFCWKGLAVFFLGVAQIVGGVLLTAFTGGVLLQVGYHLISEGISDCITGVKAMITGTFSWASWAISKAVSLAVSLIGFGVGKLISKGWRASKNAISGFGNKLTSLQKLISNQAKGGLQAVMRENVKNTLKYVGKEVVQQTVMYGVGKVEEKIIDKITNEIKEVVKNTVLDKCKHNIGCQPMGPLVNRMVLVHIEEQGYLSDLLDERENRTQLKGIFTDICEMVLRSHCAGLGWQNRLHSSLQSVIKRVAQENNGKMRAVCKAIQAAHMVGLCGDAIYSAKEVANEFNSAFLEELQKRVKELYGKRGTDESKIEEKRKNICGNDMVKLNAFKTEVAEVMASCLAETVFQVFHQKFSSHLVGLAQEQINGYIGGFISKRLMTDRTKEKLVVGLNSSYVANAPLRRKSNKLSKVEDQLWAESYAEEMRPRSTFPHDNNPATILEAKLLAEESGKTVVIYITNRQGQKMKMSVVHPSQSSNQGSVNLLYHPISERYPQGHYDALHNDQVVPVSGEGNNCMFQAFARGLDPDASDEQIHSRASQLRQQGADMVLKEPNKWVPLIKCRQRALEIRGGSWFMAKGGMNNPEYWGRADSYNNNRKLLKGVSVSKNIHADHQPAVDSILLAYKMDPESNLAKSLIEIGTNKPFTSDSLKNLKDQHGQHLITVTLPDQLHRSCLTNLKEFRTLQAQYISSNDVEGFLKMSVLAASPDLMCLRNNTLVNTQAMKNYKAMYQDSSKKLIDQWAVKLEGRGFQVQQEVQNVKSWLGGTIEKNDAHYKAALNTIKPKNQNSARNNNQTKTNKSTSNC